MRGIGLTPFKLFLRKVAGPDRIPRDVPRLRRLVSDRLHLKHVQAAEGRDLLEGERAVVDQPGGGRVRHQRMFLGHVSRANLGQVEIKGPPFAGRPMLVRYRHLAARDQGDCGRLPGQASMGMWHGLPATLASHFRTFG